MGIHIYAILKTRYINSNIQSSEIIIYIRRQINVRENKLEKFNQQHLYEYEKLMSSKHALEDKLESLDLEEIQEMYKTYMLIDKPLMIHQMYRKLNIL